MIKEVKVVRPYIDKKSLVGIYGVSGWAGSPCLGYQV